MTQSRRRTKRRSLGKVDRMVKTKKPLRTAMIALLVGAGAAFGLLAAAEPADAVECQYMGYANGSHHWDCGTYGCSYNPHYNYYSCSYWGNQAY